MLLKEVPGIEGIPFVDLLKPFRIWEMDVTKPSPALLAITHKMIEIQNDRESADAIFEALAALLLTQWVLGEVNQNHFAFWVKSSLSRLSDEFLEILKSLSPMEAAATFLGLVERMEIQDVIHLTWDKAKTLPLSSESLGLLNGLPRSINGKHVFWRFDQSNRPTPLADLQERLFEATGMTWGKLQDVAHSLYDTTSSREASAEFIKNISKPT